MMTLAVSACSYEHHKVMIMAYILTSFTFSQSTYEMNASNVVMPIT